MGPWNWSIWRAHFSTYTPILDFIHAAQYLFAAAKAWETNDAARWSGYLELAAACWQGRVAQMIEPLHAELAARGLAPDAEVAHDSPHEPLVAAPRYFHNNRKRMDSPRYRRQGFPITTAPRESLVTQIKIRGKGTEKFWNDPAGAEPILQLRATSLSEDDRLDQHLRHRPGSPFTRRSTLQTAAFADVEPNLPGANQGSRSGQPNSYAVTARAGPRDRAPAISRQRHRPLLREARGIYSARQATLKMARVNTSGATSSPPPRRSQYSRRRAAIPRP